VVGSACALFVALSVTAQTYLSMLGHGHSFWRIFWWQFSVAELWALFAPLLVRVGARLHDRGLSAATWAAVAGIGALAVGAHTLITALLSIWLSPFVPVVVSDITTAIRTQFESQFATDVLVFAVLIVLGRTIAVSDRARRLELRESKLEAALAWAQLEALRLEIQPHFLFNTLNSIAALIRQRANDSALDMLLGLSSMMRSTIDRPPAHVTPLATEVEFVRQYLELQAARYGDRLSVQIRIAPDAMTVQVPSFLLQPLVENALRHGISKTPNQSRLEITASVSNNAVIIDVRDNGVGLPPAFDLERDSGTGLRNIRVRLLHLYGSDAHLSLSPLAPGGTLASVRIPTDGVAAPAAVSA
jgi:LytS/YehU family sensor histidine kinase